MRTLAVLLVLLVAACGRGAAPPPEPYESGSRVDQFLSSRRQPAVTKKTSRIRTGDVLRVAVDGVVEVSGEYTVEKDGTIRLPFADDAKVAGTTLKGAAKAIARSLEPQGGEPEVEVTLAERTAGEVEVSGAVKRPGQVGIGIEGRTIAAALEYAGGLTAEAGGTIRLVPGTKGSSDAVVSPDEAVEFSAADVTADGSFGGLYLRPGDRLEVAGHEAVAAAEEPAPVDAAPAPEASPSRAADAAPIESDLPEALEPEAMARTDDREPEPPPLPEAPPPAPAPVARDDAETTLAMARDVARQREGAEREIARWREKIDALEAEIEKERATSEVLRARLAVLEDERRRSVVAPQPPSPSPAPPRESGRSTRRSIEERVPLEREGRDLVVSERRTAIEVREQAPDAPAATDAAPLASASSSVAVEGMVENPGEYPVEEARSVRRAVARAGIVAGADLSVVEVVRAGEAGETRIQVNLAEVSAGRSPDLLLEAGDRVVVPGHP